MYQFFKREISWNVTYSVSESCSIMSYSLWHHGLYRPWNSPGQNTGLGSFSLLQGVFQTQGLNPRLCIAGGFFTSGATRKAQECWTGQLIPSPGDLPNPGIKPGSPALQVDSLSAVSYQGSREELSFSLKTFLQFILLVKIIVNIIITLTNILIDTLPFL